jgi:hypothetical protein
MIAHRTGAVCGAERKVEMLTKRQNLMETIKGGSPARFVNQYEAFAILMGHPSGKVNRNPSYGELNVVNAWGVTKSWPVGPGPFPYRQGHIVIKTSPDGATM